MFQPSLSFVHRQENQYGNIHSKGKRNGEMDVCIRSGKPHIVLLLGSGALAVASVYADTAVKEYAFAFLYGSSGPSECRVCAQPIQTQSMVK